VLIPAGFELILEDEDLSIQASFLSGKRLILCKGGAAKVHTRG